MYKVKVYVSLKESVLDPQGSAVQHALHSMTYNEVQLHFIVGHAVQCMLHRASLRIEHTFF